MRRLVGIAMLLALGGLAAVATRGARADGTKEEDAAQRQAEAWLALVDTGQYDASWDQAATYFQRSIPKERWRQAASAAREPLGKLVSRKVQARQYAEQLPGAPDGKYVVITFASSFEHKKSALETITPMLDGTRGWRVSGYFIK